MYSNVLFSIISFQYKENENRTTVTVVVGDRTVTSNLTIRMAMVNDSGDYVCRVNSPLIEALLSNPALVLVQGQSLIQ